MRFDTDTLEEIAADNGCDIAVYGHTHIAKVSNEGRITVINPGSASRPRDEMRPSFAVMELMEGKPPKVETIRFDIEY